MGHIVTGVHNASFNADLVWGVFSANTADHLSDQISCCVRLLDGSILESGATAKTGGDLHGAFELDGRFTELGRSGTLDNALCCG